MLSRDEVPACGSFSVTFPFVLSSLQIRVDAVDQGKMLDLFSPGVSPGPM